MDSRSVSKELLKLAGVYLLFIGILWAGDLLQKMVPVQLDSFYGEIAVVFTAFILLPAVISLAKPLNDDTGISFFRNVAGVAGLSLPVMMGATFLSFPVVGGFGLDTYGWDGGLVIAGVHLLAVPLLWMILRRYRGQEAEGFRSADMKWFVLTYLFVMALVFLLYDQRPVLSNVLRSLFFIGLSEEFLFRGYFQGRLNQLLGKPFTILKFRFGWGWIVAALLFGLSHVLAPGDPGIWAWGFWTFCAGLAFGVIREKSGSFVASGIIHGIIMVFPVFFS